MAPADSEEPVCDLPILLIPGHEGRLPCVIYKTLRFETQAVKQVQGIDEYGLEDSCRALISFGGSGCLAELRKGTVTALLG